MTGTSPSDRCIPYGRGGAGNMRKFILNRASESNSSNHPMQSFFTSTSNLTSITGRKSSIRESWFKVMAANPSPLHLTSCPEDHYAASKSEPRRKSTNSSTWSTSTAGNEHRSMWRRWLGRRKDSVAEEDVEDKVAESEISAEEAQR